VKIIIIDFKFGQLMSKSRPELSKEVFPSPLNEVNSFCFIKGPALIKLKEAVLYTWKVINSQHQALHLLKHPMGFFFLWRLIWGNLPTWPKQKTGMKNV